MKAQLAEDFPLLCHSLPFYFLNISPVTLKIEVAHNSHVIQESDIHLINTAVCTLLLLRLCLPLFTDQPAEAFSVFDDATKFEHNVAPSSSKLCFPPQFNVSTQHNLVT